MRTYCLAVVSCAAGLLLLPGAVQAAPCPAGVESALTMKAPPEAAVGRQALVRVAFNHNGDPYPDADAARLEMLDEQGRPFFVHDFTYTELLDLQYSFKSRLFYVRLDPGDQFADLRLTITQTYSSMQPPYGSTDCEVVQQARVSVTAGVRPLVRFAKHGLDFAKVRITHPRGCDVAPVEPVALRVRQGSRAMTLTLNDACDDANEGWRRRGRVAGLSFRGSRPRREQLQLIIGPATWRESRMPYRLTLSYAGRVVARRWAAVGAYRIPSRRVWEGSDRFWNYCIRENKDVFSSGGRLYCIEPGSASRWVSLYRRKPASW